MARRTEHIESLDEIPATDVNRLPGRGTDQAMKIRMTETHTACPDGFTPKEYREGETYEVADHLGGLFVGYGWAEKVEHESAHPVEEAEKKVTPAKETRAPKAGAAKKTSRKKKA